MSIFKFKKKATVAPAASSETEEVELSAEEVQARIEVMEEENTALAGSVVKINQQLGEKTAEADKLKETIASQAAEIAKLKEGPAVQPTAAAKAAKDGKVAEGGSEKKHAFYNPDAAHNKTATELLGNPDE